MNKKWKRGLIGTLLLLALPLGLGWIARAAFVDAASDLSGKRRKKRYADFARW